MCFANFSVYPWKDDAALPLKQKRMGTRDTLETRLIHSVLTMMSRAQIRYIMRNYCFTSVSVSGSGADSVLCSWLWVLFFLLEELSFCFGFWVFDFACMLLLRVLDFYFRVLSVCFVLRASRELSVFDIL